MVFRHLYNKVCKQSGMEYPTNKLVKVNCDISIIIIRNIKFTRVKYIHRLLKFFLTKITSSQN